MSVLVKGMKMPDNCRECPFENYHSYTGQTVCMASLRVLAIGFGIISFDGRHSSCPITALPDKHGRLGDLDATEAQINDYFAREVKRLGFDGYEQADRETKLYLDGIINALAVVMDAPTIVEKEDGE